MTNCPTAEELASMLGVSPAPGVVAHVAGCSGCRGRLAALAGGQITRADLPPLELDVTSTPVVVAAAPLPAAASHLFGPPEPPAAIPGYEFEREVGRGGMGIVWLARHAELGRQVAVKVMSAGHRDDPDGPARFAREARAMARIEHPNVVRVHEFGEAGGRPYLVMEWVGGGSLGDRMLPVRAAAAAVRDAARGVAAAHAAGIIHRDLKPANVLLSGDPAAPTAKVTDFGLAWLTEELIRMTRSGVAVGTPAYMAPEQTRADRGPVGPAADVWGLGTVLYEQLAGRPPFHGATLAETMARVAAAEPPTPRRLRPSLPPDLEAVCLRCLEKAPARRYPSAAALADDLDRFLAGRPVSARRSGRRLRRAGGWLRGRAAATAAVAAVAVAAGVAAGRLLTDSPGDDAAWAEAATTTPPVVPPAAPPREVAPPPRVAPPPPPSPNILKATAKDAAQRKEWSVAAVAWQRAAATTNPADAPYCRIDAAYCWYLAKDYDRQLEQLRLVPPTPKDPVVQLKFAEEMCMLVSAKKFPPAERDRLLAAAVAALDRAPFENLFGVPFTRKHLLKTDGAFAPLQDRADFQALVARAKKRLKL